MTIFTPTSDKQFFSPFGPTVGYFKMPNLMVNKLNSSIEKNLSDHSNRLVGKVSEELSFDNESKKIAGDNLINFITEYHSYTKLRNSMNKEDLDPTEKYKLEIVSAWFVRQYENEYNPLHIHTGCTLSCVGYLSLPEGIENEWEDDYKNHYPANGHINFAHGTHGSHSCSNFLVKPQVGDFYIFPSYLSHCVYPFYTPGERRSFSMNMIFSK